ncbi:hypothetical protein B0T17DRAFT_530219 [Bombardia bombarda]|uniref:DUF221 domain-containing protein n=1 Tax=Bombardia bombarda TaxID=252184 RepID=A0AA39XBZ0_9PEZI|nr:hypothetical protein B0T17DRAFT_530219 [Bombardia bombarda]
MEVYEALLHDKLKRALNVSEGNDPRIGSGRDNSTGGTLSHTNGLPPAGTNSGSLKTLGTTFVPVVVFSAVFLLIFLAFRRNCPRVYAPRTNQRLRDPERPSPELPNGWFNWIKPFFAIDDTFVLNNCSLDGYFFLRFLKVLSIICLAGCCFVLPILLPVNGTGGNGLTELDLLTLGNILFAKSFYAHAAVAWCFFGFIIFMICRECIYFINVRQAYLLSPNYSNRLSSRTVLFTCIPRVYMNEKKLRSLFGESIRNIWIPKNTNLLRGLVEDREEVAERLEKAEIELIRTANAARDKQLKKSPNATGLTPSTSNFHSVSVQDITQHDAEKGKPDTEVQFTERSIHTLESPATEKPTDPEYTHPYGFHPSLPDVRGSVAAQWIPVSERPHHRPIANFGRRVDTIRWTRARLKVLNREIWKLRRKFRGGDGSPYNAAFIEFDSQANAQAAFQILAHHQPLHMSPRFIGINPNDVVWSVLRIKWWERIMRRFSMMGVITAAIIFWSFPSAFVGGISHIENLIQLVPFLSFLLLLPNVILGAIQGLLPALALSWLMAIVPYLLRGCARIAGVPSHARVELFVQNSYFYFQVLQVFLVTTFVSAASAAIFDVLQNPLSAKDLLSKSLPKASNFYLSYILVQCLAGGATKLANIGDLFRHEIVRRISNNPRRQFKRWKKLTPLHWGSVYPVFTNLGVIAISYSCIAPLILVFAGLGMMFVRFVYRYNLIYVYDSDPDTIGLFYPRALMQLLVGLYIAEICLVGLFALKGAIGPLLLMVTFLIFTALVHISLNEAIAPLLDNLPRTLALEKDLGLMANDSSTDVGSGEVRPEEGSGGLAANYYDVDEHFGDEPEPPPIDENLDNDIQLRGVEGISGFRYSIQEWTKSALKARLKKDAEESGFTRILTKIKDMITPDPKKEPNILMRWLHPEIYEDYRVLQRIINPGPDGFELPEDYVRRAYWPPEMWTPAPKLWIPKDEARVSRQEVAHTKDSIPISDQACWLKGKKRQVRFDVEDSPLIEPRILY